MYKWQILFFFFLVTSNVFTYGMQFLILHYPIPDWTENKGKHVYREDITCNALNTKINQFIFLWNLFLIKLKFGDKILWTTLFRQLNASFPFLNYRNLVLSIQWGEGLNILFNCLGNHHSKLNLTEWFFHFWSKHCL